MLTRRVNSVKWPRGGPWQVYWTNPSAFCTLGGLMNIARFAPCCLVFTCLLAAPSAPAQSLPAPLAYPHLADYDSELRKPDGRVDTDLMVQRLHQLGVTTYYWLILHARTDWDDLKFFLPKAAQAHIQVWPYLVPPTESAPKEGDAYMEPFRLDYQRWAEEIARLSLQHTNLTAWVIDDFYANHPFFTPAYVGQMQQRAKSVNPHLKFLPLMYYGEIGRKFVQDYRRVIDGVVVAYPQGREDIEHARAILDDRATAIPGELSFPGSTPSQAGDFAMASTSAGVLPGPQHWLRFRQRDDYTGPTTGYHFKQLLLDGQVVWEQDVGGGTNAWEDVAVDVNSQVQGRTKVTLAFRLLDKQGVGNYGVGWQLADLRAQGLRLGADLSRPAQWQVAQRGAFEAGFGNRIKPGRHRFHIPLIVMTAAQPIEFRLRHGDPASPERIASWVDMGLQAYRAGQCDGVVTYCLDKTAQSPEFPLVQKLFRGFR